MTDFERLQLTFTQMGVTFHVGEVNQYYKAFLEKFPEIKQAIEVPQARPDIEEASPIEAIFFFDADGKYLWHEFYED